MASPCFWCWNNALHDANKRERWEKDIQAQRFHFRSVTERRDPARARPIRGHLRRQCLVCSEVVITSSLKRRDRSKATVEVPSMRSTWRPSSACSPWDYGGAETTIGSGFMGFTSDRADGRSCAGTSFQSKQLFFLMIIKMQTTGSRWLRSNFKEDEGVGGGGGSVIAAHPLSCLIALQQLPLMKQKEKKKEKTFSSRTYN